MFEITAEYVEKELKKIAFFVQYSGLFDEFPPKIRNTLERLPVEWENVRTKGEISKNKIADDDVEDESEVGEGSWKIAMLNGTLNGNPFYMEIKRGNKKTQYKVTYNKRKYTTSSLKKLENMVEDLASGETTKQEQLQKAYDLIMREKSNINRYAQKYYLNQASNKNWSINTQKDDSRIYIRFTVDVEDKAEKDNIKTNLSFDNNMRINAVGTYIKNKILPKAGVDATQFNLTHKFIEKTNQYGFSITIK